MAAAPAHLHPSRDRKRKQKQKSLESQKKLKLELKETHDALEEEKKISVNLQMQCKHTEAHLLLLKQKQVKSRRTLETPIRFISKIETNDAFIDALSIPPSLIAKYEGNGAITGEGRYGVCTKVLLHGMVMCAKTLRNSTHHTKSLLIHEASMLTKLRHQYISFIIGVQLTKEPLQLITTFYCINEISVSVYDTLSGGDTQRKASEVVKLIRPSLTLEVWFMVMRNLAEALAYIHSKSIVHRDLKSDNVVLNKTGENIQCVLVDFGKSNYINKVARYQLTNMEKELYRKEHKHIAPDLVDGVSDVTTASDMYSFGRLLKNVINYFPLAIDTISIPIQKAIKKCLKYNYPERPSANHMMELFNKSAIAS